MSDKRPLTDEEFEVLAGQVAEQRVIAAGTLCANMSGKTPVELAQIEAASAMAFARLGVLSSRLNEAAHARVRAEQAAATTTQGPNQ